MTTPDRILAAGAVRLVAETYRDAIAHRAALIATAGHAEPTSTSAPVIVCTDEIAALYRANRIDRGHLAVAEALRADLAQHRSAHRYWWWPW